MNSQNQCAEYKIRLERKAGEMLRKQIERGERDGGGEIGSESKTSRSKTNL